MGTLITFTIQPSKPTKQPITIIKMAPCNCSTCKCSGDCSSCGCGSCSHQASNYPESRISSNNNTPMERFGHGAIVWLEVGVNCQFQGCDCQKYQMRYDYKSIYIHYKK